MSPVPATWGSRGRRFKSCHPDVRRGLLELVGSGGPLLRALSTLQDGVCTRIRHLRFPLVTRRFSAVPDSRFLAATSPPGFLTGSRGHQSEPTLLGGHECRAAHA